MSCDEESTIGLIFIFVGNFLEYYSFLFDFIFWFSFICDKELVLYFVKKDCLV